MIISDLVQRRVSLGNGIALSPVNGSLAAAVVEAILGTRSTMEIDHDLDALAICPVKGFRQPVVCALHVRLTVDGTHGPVPNGYPDHVDAVTLHLGEVAFGDPAAPVGLETVGSFTAAQSLAEGVLCHEVSWNSLLISRRHWLTIHDVAGSCFEYAGSDPRLEDEPAA